jgi:hypothetical protein
MKAYIKGCKFVFGIVIPSLNINWCSNNGQVMGAMFSLENGKRNLWRGGS